MEALKIGFPFFHSRIHSSVTYTLSTGGTDMLRGLDEEQTLGVFRNGFGLDWIGLEREERE